MYIRDLRIMDIENNTPLKLREVNATDIQIENFINDRIKPIREIVINANALIEKIQSDDYLSDSGKEVKINEVCTGALEKISEVSESAQRKYRSYLAELSRRIEPRKQYSTGNDVLDFLELQEIRKALSNLNQKEVLELYRKANESNNDERLVRAIEENPINSIKPLVPSEQIENARQERLVKDNPDIFSEINMVEVMDAISQQIANTAKQLISNCKT